MVTSLGQNRSVFTIFLKSVPSIPMRPINADRDQSVQNTNLHAENKHQDRQFRTGITFKPVQLSTFYSNLYRFKYYTCTKFPAQLTRAASISQCALELHQRQNYPELLYIYLASIATFSLTTPVGLRMQRTYTAPGEGNVTL